MKKIFKLILIMLAVIHFTANGQIFSLPADQESDIKDICLLATHDQFAIDVNTAETDLQSIYNKMNFANYNIEVISCYRLRNSALAYFDATENRSYILVNPNKLTNLNEKYFSHAFIIAHEFSHIVKHHFSSLTIPTNEHKRQLELQADEYAATIIKKMGGTIEDCIYALNSLNNPTDDTYSDHPTLEKRIAAVTRGFNNVIDNPKPVHSQCTDLFPTLNNMSLIKYPNGLNSYDITSYSQKQKMLPYSIVNLDNVYWIYWQRDDSTNRYYMYWNYSYYPGDSVQTMFNKGFNIKFLEQINNKWFVVMIKYPSTFSQKTRTINKASFKDDIRSYLQDGYYIQNITDWSATQYFVLLSKDSDTNGNYAWGIRDNFDDFTTWYEKQNHNGFNFMYCYKHINGGYFGFMTKKAGVNKCMIESLTDSNIAEVIQLINSGYKIENITCDEHIKFTLALY